ncbi:MAG: nitroreductase family protein [Eubacteriales bacterium]
MDLMEAMKNRHSVRQFTDKPLDADAVAALQKETERINQESGLHIQLITNEPDAFDAGSPSYGSFQGCRNYFTMVGPKGKDEEIGYYGEQLVLLAQTLGINSCWVAMTYKKGKSHGVIAPGEKRYMVIALGYGKTQGTAHKVKTLSEISDYKDGDPDWYKGGLEAALLAPTAINQQKFMFTRNGDKVSAKVSGFGFYTKTDLGIVKYHFELGSGKGKEIWI